MKRIARLVLSVVIVTMTGCQREVDSATSPWKPKPEAVRKVSHMPLGPTAITAAQLDNSLEECTRRLQYQRMEELAEDVPQVCTGKEGEAGVDALIAKVAEVLDAYECRIQSRAMPEKTALVSPFVREVESHWAKRWFDLDKTPPEDLLHETERFYALTVKTVDLLQKKVGNSRVTASLEIGVCSSLKHLSHHLERVGWHEQKKHVDRMVEKWKETRYDVMEGNPLKDACEDTEFYAAKDPHREKRHPAVYSRTKNMYIDKALRVVGRYPKWFAAWVEEMEHKDASGSK